jgi:tyrosine-specific transport protein
MKHIFHPSLWKAIGLIGGMIIGSGMFALPYAVSVSGVLGTTLAAIIAYGAVLAIHLAYGEIVANTKERHRLPGYVRMYLGAWAGRLNSIIVVVGFNTGLLVYGTLGGIFLSTMFDGSAFFWTLVFFGLGSIIILVNSIERIGLINFFLAVILIVATLWISFFAFQAGSSTNIVFQNLDPFFAFGIFVFSLTGLSVIADAFGIIRENRPHEELKKAIVVGTTVPLILYVVFIAAVLMASGADVTKDALRGLIDVLGERVVFMGALVGVFAMFTSYLAMGYDLRKMYELDFGVPSWLSWVVFVVVPIVFFISGFKNFVALISLMGGVLIAFNGIFVVFILRILRKKINNGIRFLRFSVPVQVAIVVVFLASIAYELVYHIF